MLLQFDLKSFFATKIESAQHALSLSLSDDVHFYLTQFFLRQAIEPNLDLNSALGFRLLASRTVRNDPLASYEIADTVLFVGGYFPEYLTKQAFSRGYYFGIGREAFSSQGRCGIGISESFDDCIDVVLHISGALASSSPITLYELAQGSDGVAPSREARRILYGQQHKSA